MAKGNPYHRKEMMAEGGWRFWKGTESSGAGKCGVALTDFPSLSVPQIIFKD
jgi:hypothetical protein